MKNSFLLTSMFFLVAGIVFVYGIASSPPLAPQVQAQGIVGFGVIGDSGSDEYRADDNRAGSTQYAATTLNWLELLASKKGLNVGSWSNTSRGEPRRRGYEYNYARSGQRVQDALNTGQHTSMRNLVSAGTVTHVYILIGANDAAEWNNTYQDIYNGTISGTALQTKENNMVTGITTIVDTVKSGGNPKIVLATVPDLNIDPSVVGRYPDATKRQRVTNFINSVNNRLKTMAQSRNVPVFDTLAFFMSSVASKINASGNIVLAGQQIDTRSVGNEPHHMILGDGVHGGTVVSGLVANGIMSAFNSNHGTSFSLFTDAQIVQNAGIGAAATSTPTQAQATPTRTPTPVSNTVTPTLSLKNGDANNDGVVNAADIVAVLQAFLQNTTSLLDQFGDGKINAMDIARVIAQRPVTPTSGSSPTPTLPPTGSGQNSVAMGKWSPNPTYDTCTVAQHDAYKVRGPDGKWYPTWHPPVDPGTGCRFGHEHGRDPSGSELLPFLKEQYGYDANGNGTVDGAELATAGVPFGYVNEQLDTWNASKNITNGMRHEDHVGHKIEWENNLMRQWSTNTGGVPRGPDSGIRCDFFMKAHQGTHSKDAFTNNMHELIQGYDCTDGTKIANAQMLLFGRPGGFVDTTGTSTFVPVGPASPPNSPNGGNAPGRLIPPIAKVRQFITVPQGTWSLYSEGIYEDWISGNYVRKPDGTWIAYYDPHFAVFSPSRFYWPGSDTNTMGITRTAQDKAENMGRSVDLCYMSENNGAERARGGQCDLMTNYGQLTERIAWDDPRSHFNGVKREFYFNNMGVENTGGVTTWYADPFGNNAQTTPFTGSVKHFLKPKNGSTPHPYPFESNAIGGERNYGGNGVHAPN